MHSLVDVYVGDEVLVELDGRAVTELGVAPGVYKAAVEACADPSAFTASEDVAR